MKIAFAIKALGNPGGGAERVLVQVASGLALRGHDVTVITNDAIDTLPYYPLSEQVHRIQLGIGDVSARSKTFDLFSRLLAMRRILFKLRPDVTVAFMLSTYLPTGIAMFGSSIPVIASEHIGPEHYRKRPVQRLLLNLSPLFCRRITVVSEQIRLSYGRWLRRRMVTALNPLTAPSGFHKKNRALSARKVLLTVGRLESQKNHAVLLAAFGSIATRFPDWTVRIVGEGSLRGALEAQITELGLSGKVELVGALSNVNTEYAGADIFILPSSYESFGLATAEALLHGLPAVGFADCPGTNVIIRHDENGKLVSGIDKVSALADALADLMDNPAERNRLALTSRQYLIDEYGLERVLDRWEVILMEVCA